jgi:hypothetical protein
MDCLQIKSPSLGDVPFLGPPPRLACGTQQISCSFCFASDENNEIKVMREDICFAHNDYDLPGAHNDYDLPGAHNDYDQPTAHAHNDYDQPSAHNDYDQPSAHAHNDYDQPSAHNDYDLPLLVMIMTNPVLMLIMIMTYHCS